MWSAVRGGGDYLGSGGSGCPPGALGGPEGPVPGRGYPVVRTESVQDGGSGVCAGGVHDSESGSGLKRPDSDQQDLGRVMEPDVLDVWASL